MRDDFEITTDHIDLIADTAVEAGALGARMTGGGFGGCVIALAPAEEAERIADAIRNAVARRRLQPANDRPYAGRPGSRTTARSGASDRRGPHQAGRLARCDRPA